MFLKEVGGRVEVELIMVIELSFTFPIVKILYSVYHYEGIERFII